MTLRVNSNEKRIEEGRMGSNTGYCSIEMLHVRILLHNHHNKHLHSIPSRSESFEYLASASR